MRIILDGERSLRVQAAGSTLEVESKDPAVDFSPLHMLAASLATCTDSVVAVWAMQAGLELEDLEIGVTWEYVEDPYRVGRYDLVLNWPSLPADRRTAASRVARHCTVEHTLEIPPVIDVRVAA
jgi:uncharacterized OsmC-like protein